MGQIKNKSLYPLDDKITEDDYLLGTDNDTSNKRTKNFSMKSVAEFIAKQNNTIPSDGTWVYRFNDDTSYDFGDFYTPGFDLNGGEDPNIGDVDEIVISNKCIEDVAAEKLLNLAGQAGVIMMFHCKDDFNNYFVIKNPTLSAASIDYTKIAFTETYASKSFKQGSPYSIRFFFTSDFTPDLYRETNTSSVDNPTSPPDGGVHIGKKDKVKILSDKIEIDDRYIYLTDELFKNGWSELAEPPSDEDVRTFRVIAVEPGTGRIFPLRYGDVQPDWSENDSDSRYYIQNRFPQRDINTNYTIQASDNGTTIFANTGSGGSIEITVDKDGTGMSAFRQCKIVQLGTGTVMVKQATGGVQYLFAKVSGNLIGGNIVSADLIRQVSVSGGVTTYGNFYLFNGMANTEFDWITEDV